MANNTITRLKKQITVLEKQKQNELDKKIKELLKNDPTLKDLQDKINTCNKLLKEREDMELKAMEIDEKIESYLK